MKIAIMQPTFNPWLGYFNLIDYVDNFVFLDIIKLNQQSWQTRNKIKVHNKELLFSILIETNIFTLSEMNYLSNLKKGDFVLDICKFFKTNEYISPLGAKEYLQTMNNKFLVTNINIFYQEYNHPKYNQVGEQFIPYIGIFDLLLNEGFDNSIKIIREGRNYIKNI